MASAQRPQTHETLGEMSRLKRFFFSSILIVVSVVIAAIAAEVYLQITSPERAAIPFYNRLYPYTMFRPAERDRYISAEKLAMSHFASQVYHYTDENGFRVAAEGYKIPIEKAPGELRVAVLGGSAIQLGSTYDTTLPGALKRVLIAKYPGRKVEVINAGIVSCVSRQSIAHFLFNVAKYKPDFVVLYDGVNDLGMPMTYESRSNFPYNFQTMEAAWDEYRSNRQDSVWETLWRRSRILSALQPKAESEAKKASPNNIGIGTNARSAREVIEDKAYTAEFVRGYLENWELLIDLSQAYGFRPLFILQPTGGFDRDYALPLMEKDFGVKGQAADEWIHAFRVLYDEAERQMAQLRQRHGDVKFLNWSQKLTPAKRHFWDLVHVYDETNTALAQDLLTEMEPLP